MEYIQEYTKPTSYPVKVANIYMPIITRIVQLLSAYVIYIVGVLPVCLSGNYSVGHSEFVEMNANGLKWFLFALIMPWLCDSGAFFSGSKFGKHRMSPKIRITSYNVCYTKLLRIKS